MSRRIGVAAATGATRFDEMTDFGPGSRPVADEAADLAGSVEGLADGRIPGPELGLLLEQGPSLGVDRALLDEQVGRNTDLPSKSAMPGGAREARATLPAI